MRRRAPAGALCLSLAAAAAALAVVPAARASPGQDYVLFCMGCHGPDAQGVPGKVPPLATTLALFMRSPEGRNYLLRVPGAANSALSDAQLAAVLNWLAERYPAPTLPAPAPFTIADVSAVRHVPLASVSATRLEVVRALAATGAAPPAGY